MVIDSWIWAEMGGISIQALTLMWVGMVATVHGLMLWMTRRAGEFLPAVFQLSCVFTLVR